MIQSMAQKTAVGATQLRTAGSRLPCGMTHSLTPQAAAIGLLTRYYAAFNAGNHAAMLDLLADDVAHDTNQGGRETGRGAFAVFLERMHQCYGEQLIDLVLWADESGTRAAAEFTVIGRYLRTDAGLPEATGQTYRLPAGAFFSLEGGRLARVTMYYNLADWLRQVGAA